MLRFLLLFCLMGYLPCFAQIDPQRITIARDSFGIPHIFAPTDPEVAYGLAWAHAEDDFNSLQEIIWPIKGLMGKALGKKGAAGDYAVALFRCKEITKERWNTLTPAFLRLAAGYVQGVNDYAKTHKSAVKVKGTFPITVEDYIAASVLALTVFNGGDRALQQIFSNKVPLVPTIEEGKKGSNAFAIHSSKSDNGDAMLVINAHQPNTGSQAFYEAHVCSEEGWNAMGGLLSGGPCILHGFNEHLGWAHTVNYVDRVDIFQLQMNPENPLQYRFDDHWENLEVKKIHLKIKGIPIKIAKKVYWSKYGATMKNKQGTFSIRLGANQRIGALQQWYAMNKATNFTTFYQALRQQELSMFNIIYADKYDTIFYINHGLVPVRNPDTAFHWKATVPGNTSRTLWTTFRKINELPQYINPPSGYLFNTNHSPFLATGFANNLSPNKFSSTDGWETHPNNRSARVYDLMPDGKISLNQLKRIKFDKQYPTPFRFPVNLDSLYLVRAADYPDLADIITMFQQWDRQAVPASQGAALFLLNYKFFETSRPNIVSKDQAIAAFNYMKTYQLQHFGRTGLTLGDLQKLVRGSASYPMYGMQDMLAAEWGVPQADGTFKVVGGDGYVVFVRFPKNGLPIAESMNMYGASANPNSQHFNDQVDNYLQQRTKPITLDKATVLAHAEKIYHPN